MDPNEALKRCRQVATQFKEEQGISKEEIHVLWDFFEHFDALDAWLSKGGFLPTAWERAKRNALVPVE